jgi:tRNA nucleotidyltransferase (CCA-adding enzyme)
LKCVGVWNHPEVDTGVHLMMVLDHAAKVDASLRVRFACLCHDLGKGTTAANLLPRHLQHEQRSVALLRKLCARLKVPGECREIAEVVAAEHGHVHASGALGAKALLRLLERCDALRRPQRFAEVLLACECDARGRLGLEAKPYPQRDRLWQALARATSVDTGVLAAQAAGRGLSGEQVGQVIRAARLQALQDTAAGEAGKPVTAAGAA